MKTNYAGIKVQTVRPITKGKEISAGTRLTILDGPFSFKNRNSLYFKIRVDSTGWEGFIQRSNLEAVS